MNTQYSIYQINPGRDKDRARFLGSRILKLVLGKSEVDPAIYDKVYDGVCDPDTLRARAKFYALMGVIEESGNSYAFAEYLSSARKEG